MVIAQIAVSTSTTVTITATRKVARPAIRSDCGTSSPESGPSRSSMSPRPTQNPDESIQAADSRTNPEVNAAPRYSARTVSTPVPIDHIDRRGIRSRSAMAITATSTSITAVSPD